jgi:hypothetical protein
MCKLDTFTVIAGIRTTEFQITECEPEEYCSVTASTKSGPFEHRDDDRADIGCDDIGGCPGQLDLFLELVPAKVSNQPKFG